MEILIVAMIMTVVVKRGVEDVWHTARGGTPPRLAAANARRKSGAAGRYWGQLWDDVWTDAADKRAARRAGSSPTSVPRPRGAATQFFAGLLQDGRRAAGRSWENGWTRLDERRRTKATRPRPGQETVPGTVVPNAEDGDRPQDRPGPNPSSVPIEDDAPVPPSRDEESVPSPTDLQDEDQSGPDSVPDYVPDFDPSPATPTTEGPTMTTTMPTDTEVVTLNKAIDYCESTARVATEMIYSIDTSQSNLAAGGVTGTALAEFATAKEGFGSVAAAFERAAKEFKDQLAIQEAFIANPGAGTKEFIMGGR